MTDKHSPPVPWLRSKTNIALLVFLGIAAYFLLTEHWAHVVQALPYLLVLGCIVMHLFMHHGHSHGSGGDERQQNQLQSRGEKDEW